MNITTKWDELSNVRANIECEELILRNTFVNAQMGPLADLRFQPEQQENEQHKIKWIDNNENDKKKLVTNKSEEDLVYKEEVQKIDLHRSKSSNKSTIKPFKLNLSDVTGV